MDRRGGYLFAIVNPYDTLVDVGVLLEPAETSSARQYSSKKYCSKLSFRIGLSVAKKPKIFTRVITRFIPSVPARTTFPCIIHLAADATSPRSDGIHSWCPRVRCKSNWTQIAFEVTKDSVTLYFKCVRFAEREVSLCRNFLRSKISDLPQLTMEDAHKLYIGSAGPILGSGFEVHFFE
ncbi:hypothetical protein COOONC_11119 [Cooperia oncophora]